MARVRNLAGRPIEQHTSPNRGGAMSDHRGVVLHIAQGTYRGTISWQMNPDQQFADGTRVTTCSTWIVGRQAGEWAQMVDTNDIAWCQQEGSRTWLSIELAGFAPNPPSAWQVEACAQLLAWAHKQHGIPVQVADHPGERGLGHHSMDREFLGESWGHDECPGSGVTNAKAAIVRRAKEIAEGDLPLTDAEIRKIAKQAADAVWAEKFSSPALGVEDMSARDWLKAGRATLAAVRALDDPVQLAARLTPALLAELEGQLGDLTEEQLQAAVERGVRTVFREGVD
jgi:N-acetylmuramoyl-L-alanine amidase